MAFFSSLLMWMLSLMVLTALGLWVVRHPVWALSSVELHGEVSHQHPERFRNHLVSQLKGNFLTLDLKQVQSVAQSVPWVRKAVVKRAYPNRLLVTLEEHKAFAWWQTASGSTLVNTKGEIFEAFDAGDGLDDLPELVGPKEQAAQIKDTFERIQPAFLKLGFPVWRLELTDQGGWQATIGNAAGNAALIALGRGQPAEIESRVQRFILTLPKVMKQLGVELEMADLRYPQAYAVRLKGVGTNSHSTPSSQDKSKEKSKATSPSSR